MSSKFQVSVISFVLAALGFFVLWYKVVYLGIPILPHAKQSLYTISSEISFKGNNAPADISMALPESSENMRIISEESESGDFGYTISKTLEGQRAQWAKREVKGNQKIFYKITVAPENSYAVKMKDEVSDELFTQIPDEDVFVLWEESDKSAALNLLDLVRSRSAGPSSFTAELITQFNAKEPLDSVSTLLHMKDQNRISLITTLLRYEKIPYRKVRGVYLEDGQKGRRAVSMLEVKSGKKWELFSYKEGHTVMSNQFLFGTEEMKHSLKVQV